MMLINYVSVIYSSISKNIIHKEQLRAMSLIIAINPSSPVGKRIDLKERTMKSPSLAIIDKQPDYSESNRDFYRTRLEKKGLKFGYIRLAPRRFRQFRVSLIVDNLSTVTDIVIFFNAPC